MGSVGTAEPHAARAPEWETLLPAKRGTLPGGAPLRRTDPGGPDSAKVVLLGLYPALTEKQQLTVGGKRMWLPAQVEATTFEPGSASGAEMEEHFLSPLGLTRDTVRMLDVFPYFLANTSRGKSGRSMADNVAAFEKEHGITTGIQARPVPAAMVELARELPGNESRLRHYFQQGPPTLLFTLGAEVAAFVRGCDFRTVEKDVDRVLYAPVETRTVFGTTLQVVHLAHPGLFIKKKQKWVRRHHEWCRNVGRELVEASRGD